MTRFLSGVRTPRRSLLCNWLKSKSPTTDLVFCSPPRAIWLHTCPVLQLDLVVTAAVQTGPGWCCNPRTPADEPKSRPGSSGRRVVVRSEAHTSELQSLMRSSYAVFCLNTTK